MKIIILLIAALLKFLSHPSPEGGLTRAQADKRLDWQRLESLKERMQRLDERDRLQKYQDEDQVEEDEDDNIKDEDAFAEFAEWELKRKSLLLPEPKPVAEVSFFWEAFFVVAFVIGGCVLLGYFLNRKPDSHPFSTLGQSPEAESPEVFNRRMLTEINQQNYLLNTHRQLLENTMTLLQGHWQQMLAKEKKSILFLKASQAVLQDYLAYCDQYYGYATNSVEYSLKYPQYYRDWHRGEVSFEYTFCVDKLLTFHPVLYFFHQPQERYPFHIANLVSMSWQIMVSKESTKSVLDYLSGNDASRLRHTYGENTIDYFSPYKNTVAAQSQPSEVSVEFTTS
jgi:hypothetical protein